MDQKLLASSFADIGHPTSEIWFGQILPSCEAARLRSGESLKNASTKLVFFIEKTGAEVCRIAALKTLELLPKPDLQYWTDGSASDGVSYGGAGVLELNPQESVVKKKASGRISTSYKAELVAIDEAMASLAAKSYSWNENSKKTCLLFTDSKSAIQKLAAGPWQQTECIPNSIWDKMIQATRGNRCKIILQWIPGHAGLVFNEIADKIAKEASKLPQEATPLDFSSAKLCIRHAFKGKWEATRNPTFAMAKYVPTQKENGLTRR